MGLKKLYNGKKVLVTGHTGFKGSWLCSWLYSLGAEVIGVALSPPSSPSHFEVAALAGVIDDHRIDIRDEHAIKKLVSEVQPDFVFHLAAQALVIPSYELPLDTMTINAIGTANVLDALRQLKKQVVAVMITSDKSYDNVERVWGYREVDRLGGKDPYSASKGMAELAIRSYVESFFSEKNTNIRVGVTRAGNVIGGGDWAEDRIIPDIVRSLDAGEKLNLRNPASTRPWQHVLEPLYGYLLLGAKMDEEPQQFSEAFNFGPLPGDELSVEDLVKITLDRWGAGEYEVGADADAPHEAGLLKLDISKSQDRLGWKPKMSSAEAINKTVDWYSTYKDDPIGITERQIKEYFGTE